MTTQCGKLQVVQGPTPQWRLQQPRAMTASVLGTGSCRSVGGRRDAPSIPRWIRCVLPAPATTVVPPSSGTCTDGGGQCQTRGGMVAAGGETGQQSQATSPHAAGVRAAAGAAPSAAPRAATCSAARCRIARRRLRRLRARRKTRSSLQARPPPSPARPAAWLNRPRSGRRMPAPATAPVAPPQCAG